MLCGERVQLRARTDDDEPILHRIAADLDSWEERSASPPAPLSLAAFRRRDADNRDERPVDFVITVDGRAVGGCTLFHEDPLARHAEAGLALLAGERGNGYGTDALRVLVGFAFTRRNLRRVHLCVLASNAGALASYRKVGFIEEGRRREHCWVRGHYEDELVMGLLRAEWRP